MWLPGWRGRHRPGPRRPCGSVRSSRRRSAASGGRAVAEAEVAAGRNGSLRRHCRTTRRCATRCPRVAGDLSPAGGGRRPPISLNSRPMKPSGVQLAIPPMRPPLRTTRSISRAVCSWSGEHRAEGRQHDVEAAIGKGQCLDVGRLDADRQAFRGAAAAARAAPARSRKR